MQGQKSKNNINKTQVIERDPIERSRIETEAILNNSDMTVPPMPVYTPPVPPTATPPVPLTITSPLPTLSNNVPCETITTTTTTTMTTTDTSSDSSETENEPIKMWNTKKEFFEASKKKEMTNKMSEKTKMTLKSNIDSDRESEVGLETDYSEFERRQKSLEDIAVREQGHQREFAEQNEEVKGLMQENIAAQEQLNNLYWIEVFAWNIFKKVSMFILAHPILCAIGGGCLAIFMILRRGGNVSNIIRPTSSNIVNINTETLSRVSNQIYSDSQLHIFDRVYTDITYYFRTLGQTGGIFFVVRFVFTRGRR